MTYSNVHGRSLPFLIDYVHDLARYRHLCWNLVGSDLRARFRRSTVGILWATIQPMAFAMMIATIWGAMLKVPNYWDFALYTLSGLIVWEYFATVVNISQDSLRNAEGYLKQTRIPFLTFQVRVPLTAAVISLFGILGLVIMQTFVGALPGFGLHLLLLPAFFVLLIAFGLPMAVLMSVLGLVFRDLKYISQIAVQALFFVSPVMLDRGLLERPEFAPLKYLNPVVPLLDLFRDPIVYGQLWKTESLLLVLGWIAALWIMAVVASIKVGRRLIFAL